MNIVRIKDLGDPRLAQYRELKRKRRTRDDNYFVVEGRFAVERLLLSRFQTDSILVAERRLDEISCLVDEDTPVLVIEQAECEKLVGFQFHSGVLACGVRQRIEQVDSRTANRQPELYCAFPHTFLDANLGAMIRSSCAFGATGVIVGSRSADPFSRMSIRSSMGNVFFLPVIQPRRFSSELIRLRDQYGFELVAVCQNQRASELHRFPFAAKTILVFGNEAKGISLDITKQCSAMVQISIADQVDSLNVSASAAVVLYEWRQRWLGAVASPGER